MKIAAAQIVGADEIGRAADRPSDRRGIERERARDLVQELQRITALAVHLVDEGQDRDVAQAADLEQLARAALDALRGVDHHHGRIDGGQSAIRILRKVLVARRVEQVEDATLVLEGHNRGDDGDAPLALDAHPVRARAAALALRAHIARELDRPARAQKPLGQGGLASIGVGDDRERAASRDLGQSVGHCASMQREGSVRASGSRAPSSRASRRNHPT